MEPFDKSQPGFAWLNSLRRVSLRLYSEDRMSGDEMRDAAQTIQSVVEALGPRLQENVGPVYDAAPELLESCEALLGWVRRYELPLYGKTGDEAYAAQAAIAKARGE